MKRENMLGQLPEPEEYDEYIEERLSLQNSPGGDFYKLMYEELTIIDRKTSGQLAFSSILAILFFNIHEDLLEVAQDSTRVATFIPHFLEKQLATVGGMLAALGLVLEAAALIYVIRAIMATWVPTRRFIDEKIIKRMSPIGNNGIMPENRSFSEDQVSKINHYLLKERCDRTKYYAHSWTLSHWSVWLLVVLSVIFYVAPSLHAVYMITVE